MRFTAPGIRRFALELAALPVEDEEDDDDDDDDDDI